MARWWINTMDPDRGFIPPNYATPALRVADILRPSEVVLDVFLQQPFVGNGVLAGGLPLGAWPGAYSPGLQFEVQGTILSSAPTTPVIIFADSMIPAGKAVYVNYILVTVNGATAWTTAYNVILQDNAAVAAITIATANLLGNVALQIGSTGVTPNAALLAQAGLTVGRGLQIVGSSASIIAGSPLIWVVGGYVK